MPANAKIHGTDQVAKIAASMAKFGWTVPCMVADDGELIAGHGRVLAAAMLGLKDVPVIRLSHLDEAERRAYRIADNKLTELGEWDEALLRDEIAGLLAEDFDLSLLGITDEDLDALLRDPDQVDGGAVAGAKIMRIQPHERSTVSFSAAPLLIGLGTLAGFATIGLLLYDKGLVDGAIYWAVSGFGFSIIIGMFTTFDGLITYAGFAAIVAGCIFAVPALF